MAVTVAWDTEVEYTVRYEFKGYWTWDEFFEAYQQAKALIDTAPGDAGVIIDARSRSINFPPNILTHSRHALKNKHPKTRIVVVVLNNYLLRVMMKTLIQVMGSDGRILHIADTPDHAREIIRRALAQPVP